MKWPYNANNKTRRKSCGKGNNREEKFCGKRSLNGQLILATQGFVKAKRSRRDKTRAGK